MFAFDFSFIRSYAKINYSFYITKTRDLQHENGLNSIAKFFGSKSKMKFMDHVKYVLRRKLKYR